MNDLKPCPFCGEVKRVGIITSVKDGVYYVACGKCGGMGGLEKSVGKAADLWNRRTEQLVFHCDETEDIPNCTVRIYRNTQTGEEDWGWWRNDKPPKEIGMVEE